MNMNQKNANTVSDAVDTAFQALTTGTTVAQLKQIDPQKIEALYALGYNYYTQKNFAKAEEIFSFAQGLNWLDSKIVKGLAASRKMQGKFQEALNAYALAGLIDMEDPIAPFHAAECFFALENYSACGEALEVAYELAQQNNEHQNIIPTIDKMKNKLKENINND